MLQLTKLAYALERISNFIPWATLTITHEAEMTVIQDIQDAMKKKVFKLGIPEVITNTVRKARYLSL